MPCLHSKLFPGTPAIWGLCWCKVSVCHHVGRESPTFSFTSSISGNVQGIRAETGTGGPGGHVDFAGATWTGSVCEDCAGWRQALWEAWNCFSSSFKTGIPNQAGRSTFWGSNGTNFRKTQKHRQTVLQTKGQKRKNLYSERPKSMW